MIVARNIRIIDLIRVLSNYNTTQFVDIGIILGKDSEPDQIKISKTNRPEISNFSYKKFELKNLNDYI